MPAAAVQALAAAVQLLGILKMELGGIFPFMEAVLQQLEDDWAVQALAVAQEKEAVFPFMAVQ